jgi:dynein intermediate chain 1
MAVYSVKWNSHHKHVFLSASADWSVKIWHAKMGICLLNFDLQQAVGDASWAPYSSTVFAATTADGVVHFFDLNVNRNERILYQKVVKKAKLTHVSFSPKEPVILVGDDRGATNCLKLSPNLRIVPDNEDQVAKMDKIVDMVIEPHLRSSNKN